MHQLDDERAVIDHSMDVIENFCGKRPRGWFGPGLTQTFDTLDHLSAAGVEYIGDWVLDDQPIWARTLDKPVVALPYNYELHDIVSMNIQNNESQVYRDRALDYFNTLYQESEDGRKSCCLTMHCYYQVLLIEFHTSVKPLSRYCPSRGCLLGWRTNLGLVHRTSSGSTE